MLLRTTVTSFESISSKGDEQLDGIWFSNKERTLAKIGEKKLSEERLRYLQANLGQLRLCFSGDKVAAFFAGTPKDQIEVETYQVPKQGYEKYFCRQLGVESPCG